MKGINFQGRITRLWWIPVLTGLVGVGLGVWCLFDPSDSLLVLAYIFAGVLCAAGLMNFVFGLSNVRIIPNWGWSVALGLLELVCGIWLYMMPKEVMLSTFIFTMAIWIIVVTVNAICETCVLAAYGRMWTAWLLALLLATMIFAFIFLAGPIVGGIAVWLYIGISLISFGAYRISLGLRIRKISQKVRF